jgi:hypothetical protein
MRVLCCIVYLFLDCPRPVMHWRVRCWDLVSWVVWAICGGVRWSEGIDLRDESAWREKEDIVWKRLLARGRSRSLVGVKQLIGGRSLTGMKLLTGNWGLAGVELLTESCIPCAWFTTHTRLGCSGGREAWAWGHVCVFFGPFVAAVENGGSMRVGSKCRVNGLLRRWIQGILGENY